MSAEFRKSADTPNRNSEHLLSARTRRPIFPIFPQIHSIFKSFGKELFLHCGWSMATLRRIFRATLFCLQEHP